jgi:hypothetical protein
MSLIFDARIVLAALAAAPDDAARVETTTLLPGGSVATVTVRPVGDHFTISDNGSARELLLSMGHADLNARDMRAAQQIAETRGLAFIGDTFELSGVGGEQLPAAIAYVADATRELVTSALEVRSRRAQRDLISRTADRLKTLFPSAVVDSDREFLGASTKRHKFDLVMPLAGDRYAIFQTVSPTPASIAPAHLKLFDLREAHVGWPREVVVDDLAVWPSDDLALMQQVATHVRDVRGGWDDLRGFDA